MSITLELAPEAEEALRIEASRRNESAEAVAERHLNSVFNATADYGAAPASGGRERSFPPGPLGCGDGIDPEGKRQ